MKAFKLFPGFIKYIGHYIFLSAVLFFALNQAANGQLVGSPGSNQSAVENCVPASYVVSYQFVISAPAGKPAGYTRITFRLDDMAGNNYEIVNYYSS